MIAGVLLDTGPLVALIDQRDQHHAWARQHFGEIRPPLMTCEAVLAEACQLARRARGGVAAVLELFDRGVVTLAFDLKGHFSEVSSLMHRYANVPMSLADGCLVRMSELIAGTAVFTVDIDFHVYRRHKRQRIPLLAP